MNTITKYKTNNNNDKNNKNDIDKKENEKDLFAYDFDKAMAFEHYFPENNFTKIIKKELIEKIKKKKATPYNTRIHVSRKCLASINKNIG